MAETHQRARVIRALRPYHAVAVENGTVGPGTPDVNCTLGWLELKWLRRWPKNEETVVKIDHYTPQQRIWLKRRARAGGGVWLLLQVGREWLLFSAEYAAEHIGRDATRENLARNALLHMQNGLQDGRLVECLTSRI